MGLLLFFVILFGLVWLDCFDLFLIFFDFAHEYAFIV